MTNHRPALSGYETMWLFAMFDLPSVTKKEKKDYMAFRKELLRRGFMKLQFSVYARFYPNEEASQTHRGEIEYLLPPEGQVRLISITDTQFGKMDVFSGKTRETPEDAPQQLLLF